MKEKKTHRQEILDIVLTPSDRRVLAVIRAVVEDRPTEIQEVRATLAALDANLVLRALANDYVRALKVVREIEHLCQEGRIES